MPINLNHISVYFPATVLTNEKLAADFPQTNPEQILKTTGIKNRYVSAPDEISSDMAVHAAITLFSKYKIDINQIDFLIFCTHGFDHKGPSTSCLIQHRLNLRKEIGCIDLPYGCSGYIYGLGLANGLLTSKMVRNVLFLTGDIPTKVTHPNDLEIKSIFSDIGTATLITEANYSQHFIFGTDGSGYNNLIVDNSGCRNPQTIASLQEDNMPIGHMKMNGTEIFLFAVKVVPKLVAELLEKHNYTLNDIDLFVFHQASYFMLEIIRKKLKFPKEKFFTNIETVGNSVASSIPVALEEAEQKGVLKRGMKVMLAGFGIGYSWGGTIIEY